MKKIKVGIIGGAGYTGGELIRILLNHPQAEIAFVQSKSNTGRLIGDVHADLVGETTLTFSGDTALNELATLDVLFLCVGHGDAKKLLDQLSLPLALKVVDLSQDYRLHNDGQRPSINGQAFV